MDGFKFSLPITEEEGKALLSTDRLPEFVQFLDIMFEEYYDEPGTENYRNAEITFNKFIRYGWTVKDFRDVLHEFTFHHKEINWRPIDFFKYKK